MICPLMSENVNYSNSNDVRELAACFEEATCRKDKCAWWCDNICAVVQIAKQIVRVAKTNEVSK